MVNIVYFSGTGGTARAAASFAEHFQTKGQMVSLTEISEHAHVNSKNLKQREALERASEPESGKEELLLLLFPVYALNAPLPVDRWIESILPVKEGKAAVISVSGGGEMFPNRACRIGSIKRLERKGYQVVYEEMLIMPANVFAEIPKSVAKQMLQILPVKTAKITDEILSGIVRRRKADFFSWLFAAVLTFQKRAVTKIGKKMSVNDSCISCGWCEENCPTGNIDCTAGKPVFQDKCTLCLRCIYGCPQKAISADIPDFIILKNGYDLSETEKEEIESAGGYVDEIPKGLVWKAVREYLQPK